MKEPEEAPPLPVTGGWIVIPLSLLGCGEQDHRRYLHGPDGCLNLRFESKTGDRKMGDVSLCSAGIDVSKAKLDVAVYPGGASLSVDYTAEGLLQLDRFLCAHKVERVGFEATGGYEWPLLLHLRQKGSPAARLQPGQIRAFARSRLQRAKNDRLDALLIAAFTASLEVMPGLPDPAMNGLAGRLTYIEQIEDMAATLKTMHETCRDPRILKQHQADIRRLEKRRSHELRQLIASIEAVTAMTGKVQLITSIPGVGERTAVALLVRMPEIGSLSREQVAAPAGVAPFDNNSGTRHGRRSVAGGRQRLRKSLFMAAFSATRWNPQLREFYARLRARGKHHRSATIACARKLIILVNAILARGTPWQESVVMP